jgi:hypothetical protein
MYVGVMEVPAAQHRWWGKLEFNPARVVDPDGHGVLPTEHCVDVLAAALDRAEELVRPACALGEARVKRLDVTRDFHGVSDVGSLLAGLRAVPRPWVKKTTLHSSRGRNAPETLDVEGGKAGQVRLYDKFTETDGAVPEGTLRWECEARAGWLKRYGDIVRVDDITVERVATLAENRWGWSGMGHEVMGNVEAVARVWAIEEVPLGPGGSLVPFTEAQRNSFLGWLLAASCGRDGTSSKATRAKYRRLARELGIVISPEMFDAENGGFTAQLDFDSGRELVRARSTA